MHIYFSMWSCWLLILLILLLLWHIAAIPDVDKFDSSKNLVQGDPLVLECDAWGIPEPEIVWQKDEVPIENDDRVSYSGKGNRTIRIEDLDFDDRAQYTCVATNSHGNSTSTILVRVKGKQCCAVCVGILWPWVGAEYSNETRKEYLLPDRKYSGSPPVLRLLSLLLDFTWYYIYHLWFPASLSVVQRFKQALKPVLWTHSL